MKRTTYLDALLAITVLLILVHIIPTILIGLSEGKIEIRAKEAIHGNR